MNDFILFLLNKPISGLGLLVAPTLILAYVANNFIKVIPWAIWCLILGFLLVQIEIIEDIKVNYIVTDDLLSIGAWAIAIAMMQIGLEASDFSFLKNYRFWLLIFLIVIIPSFLVYKFVGLKGLEMMGFMLLVFTSSLAVVAVFVNQKPELFDHVLIKSIMIIGVTTDIFLWIMIGILTTLKKQSYITFNDLLPQLIVLSVFVLLIYTGIKYWWRYISLEPLMWLLVGIIVAVIFYSVGFNPLLGTIFAGMLVPSKDKHHVSDSLNPFFSFSMLIYMGTVGFKMHELLNVQAVYYALLILIITTIGKYLAIRFSGLLSKKYINQATIFLGNPGTMGIAASSVLSHEAVISETIFMSMALVAIIYTLIAGLYFEKYPLELE